jgi:hypothetical protein
MTIRLPFKGIVEDRGAADEQRSRHRERNLIPKQLSLGPKYRNRISRLGEASTIL